MELFDDEKEENNINGIYLKEDDYSNMDRIEEYNAEYKKVYPNFVPFATRENFNYL